MKYPDIDIMIDSASRPFLLKQSVPIIYDNLIYSGNINWVLHEAFLFPDLSNECITFIKDNCPFFSKIVEEHNPKGQGKSITNVLKNVNSKYFIHWEDDYIALRKIDLDIIVKIMEENNDVNQIAFNKRDTMKEVSGWKKKEVEKSSYVLTTSPHWRYTPAIWRTGFIKSRWVEFIGRNSHWKMNIILKQIDKNNTYRDADWIEKNLGIYYFGKIGERAYTQHIGGGFSNRLKGYEKLND